jgi:hypothetical protein
VVMGEDIWEAEVDGTVAVVSTVVTAAASMAGGDTTVALEAEDSMGEASTVGPIMMGRTTTRLTTVITITRIMGPLLRMGSGSPSAGTVGGGTAGTITEATATATGTEGTDKSAPLLWEAITATRDPGGPAIARAGERRG